MLSHSTHVYRLTFAILFLEPRFMSHRSPQVPQGDNTSHAKKVANLTTTTT